MVSIDTSRNVYVLGLINKASLPLSSLKRGHGTIAVSTLHRPCLSLASRLLLSSRPDFIGFYPFILLELQSVADLESCRDSGSPLGLQNKELVDSS